MINLMPTLLSLKLFNMPQSNFQAELHPILIGCTFRVDMLNVNSISIEVPAKTAKGREMTGNNFLGSLDAA